jgi:hypothetical protein
LTVIDESVQATPTRSLVTKQVQWAPYSDRPPRPGWKFAPPPNMNCPVRGCSSAFAMSAYDGDVHAYKKAVYGHTQHACDDNLHWGGKILCFVPGCADGYFEPSAHEKHLCNHHLKLDIVQCEKCEHPGSCDDLANDLRHRNKCDPTRREQNL